MEQTLPATPPDPASPPPAPARGFALGPRLRAAGIHLGLSALVAALAAALVFGLWYPTPFREISGGRELFFLVVSVDVVLGPLITFAVFDRRKPWRELRRDLAVVALLQLGGLLYGLHTVYEARPVVLALEKNRLRVVRAIDLDAADLAKAPAEWQRLPLWGVQIVTTRAPRADEKLEAIDRALQGEDVGKRPEFWQPASEAKAALLQGAKPLSELQKHHTARLAELQQYVDATGRSAERLKYLPVLARRTDWVALFDADSGGLVGYAPFDGF
ncbi:TfpX/TfpZ family type IV pilin accessory protein [Methylibium sp.]|uniref:TfpX/TfpZ family type IV pilin accessory protein n=1 Tax=Methylibium sp. TaxID=2067992 RepID=UPI003D11A822